MCYRTDFAFFFFFKLLFFEQMEKKLFFIIGTNGNNFFKFFGTNGKKKKKNPLQNKGEQNNLGVDVYNNLYQSSLSECMLVIQQSKIRCGC
jgi:hypothetical protein